MYEAIWICTIKLIFHRLKIQKRHCLRSNQNHAVNVPGLPTSFTFNTQKQYQDQAANKNTTKCPANLTRFYLLNFFLQNKRNSLIYHIKTKLQSLKYLFNLYTKHEINEEFHMSHKENRLKHQQKEALMHLITATPTFLDTFI